MQETHFSLFLLFSLLALILFSSLPTISSSFPTDTFVYGGCSQLKYVPGTPFQSNLNTLLSSLLDSSSLSSYNSYNISSPTIYGLYQCRGDISTVDCPKCIQSAISQLGVLCLDACGGAIRLQGCFVKYDNATFVGVEVKTSVVKTCGSMTNEYGTDLLSRIYEVLMQLGSGNGSYRVGTARCVSGMAQCVGDLDGGECSDCITEAVQQLRTGCGLTLSGDVYLAKCYVRYSAKCDVRYSARGEVEKIGSSECETRTRFAIIIGLLVGVALIVIFLPFLMKAFQRDGKGWLHILLLVVIKAFQVSKDPSPPPSLSPSPSPSPPPCNPPCRCNLSQAIQLEILELDPQESGPFGIFPCIGL